MDGITGLLQQLIDMVKSMSPVIWEAYVKQVYVNGARNVILGIIGITFSILSFRSAKKAYDKEEDIYGVLFIFSMMSFIIALITLLSSMAMFNPEYSAIQMLISSIK